MHCMVVNNGNYIGHNELKHFDTLWRIVVRRVWELPPRTHSVFLSFIMHGKSFFDAVVSRFYNLTVNCLYSSNSHVLFMARNAGCFSLSFFGKNLIHQQMSESEVSLASPYVNLLCELVFCRSGYFYSVLSDAETEFLLRDVLHLMCLNMLIIAALLTVMCTLYVSSCV